MNKVYSLRYSAVARGFIAVSEFARKCVHKSVRGLSFPVLCKRLVRTVLIFTESSDQLSRATDRVPGLPASPGYVQ